MLQSGLTSLKADVEAVLTRNAEEFKKSNEQLVQALLSLRHDLDNKLQPQPSPTQEVQSRDRPDRPSAPSSTTEHVQSSAQPAVAAANVNTTHRQVQRQTSPLRPTTPPGSDEDEEVYLAGPDGSRYAVADAIKYLAGLPEKAFGDRRRPVTKQLATAGRALEQFFLGDNPSQEDFAQEIVVALANIAAVLHYEHANPRATADECEMFGQLIDAQRAKHPFAKAIQALAKQVRDNASPSFRAGAQRQPREEYGLKRSSTTPVTACPNCKQFGHWKRDCPQLRDRKPAPLNLPSLDQQ